MHSVTVWSDVRHEIVEEDTDVEERAGDSMLSVTVWLDIHHKFDENDPDEEDCARNFKLKTDAHV